MINQIGVIGKDSEATRVYDTTCARTLTDGGGMGAKTGLYQVDKLERKQDSYDFNSRVYSSDGIAKTLAGDGGNNDNKTGLYKVRGGLQKNAGGMGAKTGLYQVMAYSKSHRTGSSDADKKRKNYGKVEHRIKTDEFNTLSTGKGCSNMSSSNFVGMGAKTGLYQIGDYRSDEGYRKRKDGNSPTLTAGNRANSTGSTPVPLVNKIRRLTPVECERLQGFPDGWTSLDGKMSDTQRYKQLGNAVTVNVVEAVGRKIKEK